MKTKPNIYEITYSLRSDPMQWNSLRVEEGSLLFKMMEVMNNKSLQIECVALVQTSHKNRYDLPLPGD